MEIDLEKMIALLSGLVKHPESERSRQVRELYKRGWEGCTLLAYIDDSWVSHEYSMNRTRDAYLVEQATKELVALALQLGIGSQDEETQG